MWFSSRSPRWSRVTDTTPGPPPGYLVGGPNPRYALDACCTGHKCRGATASFCSVDYAPPLGQPPSKSYRDFNDGWPANSWEVSEPSTSYQAQYIRVLVKYIH
jgi:endoglucanase